MIFNRAALRPFMLNTSFRQKLCLARYFSSNKVAIEQILRNKLKGLEYLGINDESAKHFEAHDSHFVLHLVTDEFASQSLIQRHRFVKSLLKQEGIMDKIHALSLKTDTVEEFRTTYKEKAEEMLCRGGGKYEKKLREQQAQQAAHKDK